MKQYTPIRRFYAIIGFIHLIIYASLGVYTIIEPEKEPQKQSEPIQIMEVTNETPAEIEEEYIPAPSFVAHTPAPAPEPLIVFIQPTPTPNPQPQPVMIVEVEEDTSDLKWKSLCEDFVELIGQPREDNPRAMKSYRTCASTYLSQATGMVNLGLMGRVFNDTVVQLTAEYQSLQE